MGRALGPTPVSHASGYLTPYLTYETVCRSARLGSPPMKRFASARLGSPPNGFI